MTDQSPELQEILATSVFIRGANRRFGELTLDDVRSRADELRSATGWGPTARVAPVARAWRELAMEMERAGVGTVAALGAGAVLALARGLWIKLPG